MERGLAFGSIRAGCLTGAFPLVDLSVFIEIHLKVHCHP